MASRVPNCITARLTYLQFTVLSLSPNNSTSSPVVFPPNSAAAWLSTRRRRQRAAYTVTGPGPSGPYLLNSCTHWTPRHFRLCKSDRSQTSLRLFHSMAVAESGVQSGHGWTLHWTQYCGHDWTAWAAQTVLRHTSHYLAHKHYTLGHP